MNTPLEFLFYLFFIAALPAAVSELYIKIKARLVMWRYMRSVRKATR